MQVTSQGSHKWIMVHQDHLTKFSVRKASTFKCASKVTYQLVNIFLLVGAPHILQSYNGTDFTAAMINELKDLRKDLVIVQDKPRHPQSQGLMECANGDITDMQVAWMSENETNDCNIGIKFVQFSKNV